MPLPLGIGVGDFSLFSGNYSGSVIEFSAGEWGNQIEARWFQKCKCLILSGRSETEREEPDYCKTLFLSEKTNGPYRVIHIWTIQVIIIIEVIRKMLVSAGKVSTGTSKDGLHSRRVEGERKEFSTTHTQNSGLCLWFCRSRRPLVRLWFLRSALPHPGQWDKLHVFGMF